jgi:fatty acid desaturase
MLRRASDIRSLAFIAAWFLTAILAWRFEIHGHILRTTLLVALLATSSWQNAIITHNAIHSPIWKSRTLNRITQILLSLTYGFPVSEYLPGHNLSHHRFTQTRRDVMRTTKLRFRWNLLNLLLFFARIAPDVFVANFAYVQRGRATASWHRQHRVELVVTWSVKLVLLAIDWQRALLFIFIPHLAAVWGITTVNYLQHDGCDADHTVNHSRNFTGKIFNWLTFNNGLHGIHHLHPGLHWSLLRKAHDREIAPFIHPALDRKSLAVYLFEAFVLPGKRTRYDGSPMVLPDEGPDEDWLVGASKEATTSA